MKVLHINIVITIGLAGTVVTDDFETEYQTHYKQIISFLYAHPDYKLAFWFHGNIFSWLVKKHPEFITLLKELVARKQIEVLGGGYYNPIFPLLLPMDRNGQIEMYTTELSGALGKRPRGMMLYGSVWDATIVPSLHNSGMEYVLLDSSLVPPEKRLALPLLVSEQGKAIKVLPIYREFVPAVEKSADAYLTTLKKQVKKLIKNKPFSQIDDRMVTVTLDTALCQTLFERGWIAQLYDAVCTQHAEDVCFVLPQEYMRLHGALVPAYIAPGIRADVAQWGKVAYTAVANTSVYPVTIHDFLSVYRRNQALYNRVLHVSMLIANYHGDKMRKKLAREKLWQAQAGEAFVCDPHGVFATSSIRQNAYRALTEAEKIVRECLPNGRDFKESITCYDYNADGFDEYVCQMKSFDACISRLGASIIELDIIQNVGNYADNLRRLSQFDKVDDTYERGLFVEHLFTADEYKDYKKGLPAGNGIFSQVPFVQTAFDKKRGEIKLQGTGIFAPSSQAVSLRKSYAVHSNGFTIQYILKNESSLPLKAYLVVESNFAQTNFSSEDCNSYSVEVVADNERHIVTAQKTPDSYDEVSYVQITDVSHDVSFVYELNENASVVCIPLFFYRPKNGFSEPQIAGTTFISALSWCVDIAAGMEVEKTISVTIVTPKKKRGKSQRSRA